VEDGSRDDDCEEEDGGNDEGTSSADEDAGADAVTATEEFEALKEVYLVNSVVDVVVATLDKGLETCKSAW
jgi:hypothetical protein